MLGDKPEKYEYLQEGIYVELQKKDAKDNYDAYLINRDGQGNAKIIRADDSLLHDNKINLEISKNIEISSVAYPKDFNTKDRVGFRLDIEDSDIEKTWEELKSKAESANINNSVNPNTTSYAFVSYLVDGKASIEDIKISLSKALEENSIDSTSLMDTSFLDNFDFDLDGYKTTETLEQMINSEFINSNLNTVKNTNDMTLLKDIHADGVEKFEDFITSNTDLSQESLQEITHSSEFINELKNIEKQEETKSQNSENKNDNFNLNR